jgi:hypothetical protein
MNYPDWVVCHDASKGKDAYTLECLRCGAVQRVVTPITISCYSALARAFARGHARCPAKEEAAT